MTDRVCIVLNEHGEIVAIAADGDTEVLIVDTATPADRVYSYGAVKRGPQHVQEHVGGYAVGHAADGRLGDGDGTGRRPPSRPKLRPVK